LKKLISYLENHWKVTLTIILIINFALRIFIYFNTELFNFADYSSYFSGIDIIKFQKNLPLASGNFLFTISYIGYFSKYILCNIDYFFLLNCLLGTLASFILAVLLKEVTGSVISSLVMVFLHTIYTEFMVFSSVFYTPVLMIFLLAVFIYLVFKFYNSESLIKLIISGILLMIFFVISFFFKPELAFFPLFLLLISLISFRATRQFRILTFSLAISLITGFFVLNATGLLNRPEGSLIANDFIFFGHTDYGGDGGEGAFIYPENKIRYEEAWKKYCDKNILDEPTLKDRNRFQLLEIKKFITQHPLKWIGLQFTKFFRTFGVVPESTSFKVLYTGLFKGNLWLTSIVVVAPVALIIILFIMFFNYSALRQLFNSSTHYLAPSTHFVHRIRQPAEKVEHPVYQPKLQRRLAPGTQHQVTNKSGFLYIYLLLFIYYIIATIFFGQYQERYRLPVMVVFIIPMFGYFIAAFEKKQFLNRLSLTIKSSVIVLFLIIWIFQAKKAISNTDRLQNAIELVKEAID